MGLRPVDLPSLATGPTARDGASKARARCDLDARGFQRAAARLLRPAPHGLVDPIPRPCRHPSHEPKLAQGRRPFRYRNRQRSRGCGVEHDRGAWITRVSPDRALGPAAGLTFGFLARIAPCQPSWAANPHRPGRRTRTTRRLSGTGQRCACRRRPHDPHRGRLNRIRGHSVQSSIRTDLARG